jgi:hypothetical protein
MKKFLSLMIFFGFATCPAIYGQVSINAAGSSPDSSAILDLKSTTLGLLIPRMTEEQRDAISGPANGLLIYCVDDDQFYVNQGLPGFPDWVQIKSAASSDLTGSGTIDYLTRWLSSNTLGIGLIRDDSSTVGINSAPDPGFRLKVEGAGVATAVYGRYDANINGYLGSSNYGAYGQFSSTVKGYLGSTNYGAFGQYSSDRYGYLGSSNYGAYGQWASDRFGYMGGQNYGSYGQYSADRFGGLGSLNYGVYGQYNTSIKGYLGGLAYGAYGQYTASKYGYFGGSDYACYGQNGTDIYGGFGSANYSVSGVHNSTGGAAGYFYHNGYPGAYLLQWTINAYMANSTLNDGASYAVYGNNSGCIRAYNYNGANYTFGVAGWNFNDDNRCAGVFGADVNGDYWGALGYRSSGNLNYGGYFTSSTTGSGKSSYDTTGEGIGIGAWGGLMGADVHGGIYGMYVEGENFGLYSKGPIYTDQPVIQLQATDDQERTALYSSTSTEVTVMASGQGQLTDGQCVIKFDDNFIRVISRQSPLIITVTPMGPTRGLYIASSDYTGFSVTENNNGRSSTLISYIVIGKRAGYESPQLAREVVSLDFEPTIARGLQDDSDASNDGKGLYYQGDRLMLGQAPGSQNRNKK